MAPPACSISEVIENMKFGRFQAGILLSTGLIWMGNALELATISLLGKYLMCEWRISLNQVTILSMFMFGGTLVGSIFIGKMSDNFGRRRVMLLFTAFLLYFAFISAWAVNIITLIIVRFGLGIFVATYFHANPLMMEYMPLKLRTISMCVQIVPYAFGFFLENLLAGLVYPRYGWRIWLVASALPYVVILLSVFLLPESIRYLSVSGDRKQIVKILSKISSGSKRTFMEGDIIIQKNENRGRLADLMRKPYLTHICALAGIAFCYETQYTSLQLLQPFLEARNSVSEVTCYLNCRLDSFSFYLKLMQTSAMELIAAPVALIFLQNLSRKTTLNLGTILTGLALVPMFYIDNMSYLFIGVSRIFSSVVGTTFLMYIAEIFPTPIRCLSVGLLTSVQKSASIFSCFLSQKVSSENPTIALAILVCLSMILPFLTIPLPETSNTQLSDEL